MASAFVFEHPNNRLSDLIVAGCRSNGGIPLTCDENLKGVTLPVLDIWGNQNRKDATKSLRKEMISNTYTQVEIDVANHKFEGYEDRLVAAVKKWLKNQN